MVPGYGLASYVGDRGGVDRATLALMSEDLVLGDVRAPPLAVRPHRAVAAVVLGALVVSAALLRLASLWPGKVLGFPTYNHVFSTHAVLALTAMPLLLLYFAPVVEPARGVRGILAALYVCGAVLVGLTIYSAKWPFGLGPLVLLVGVALFVWHIVRPQWRTPSGIVLALAAASLAFGLVGALVGRPFVTAPVTFLVVVAVLLLPVFAQRAAGRPVGGIGVTGAVAICAVCVAFVRPWGIRALLALPELIAGVVISAVVFATARNEGTSWARWLRRLEAIFFVEGLLLGAFLQTLADDIHLHDTLFPVAAMHFEAFVLLFAVVRGLDGASRSRLGWIGLGLAFLGAQVFGWGCAVLGGRGMPRAYAAYLERFNALQAITSVASFVMLAGLIVILVAHVVGRRRESASLASPP